ncbi:MAG: alpha-ribazole phosphatase [Pseudomonadota bacterium]
MKNFTRIDLLRHGETQGGACFRGSTDDPLTDTGLDQMRSSTNGNHGWDQVITSPLERCASFAKAFARQRSLPITFDKRIQEMHFGAWEGHTAAELAAKDPDALARFWSNPDGYPPPGGEPLAQFQARVLAAWNSITHRHNGQHVLVVTHGGVIRVLLCHAQQRPIGKLLEIEVKHGALYSLRVSIDSKQARASERIGKA